MKKRDLIKEIIAIRQRRRYDSAQTEVFVRLLDISSSFEKREKSDPEGLKYYPIALVACIESTFKILIRDLIDFGEPFTHRAANLSSFIKFDFDAIFAFQNKLISPGDFISHGLRINNLKDIQLRMSELMDLDFLDKLKKVYKRWPTAQKYSTKPIIPDFNKTYAMVSKTFELRHIFSHELATSFKIEEKEIEECIESISNFINASIEFHNNTLYPNAPLTQADMNILAATELNSAKNQLNEISLKFEDLLNKERVAEYRQLNQ
jgi:hypothetical protein